MAEEFWALVVEDDPDSAAFTRSVLERHAGMRTTLAVDVASALVALQEQRFDLVVSDIELPGGSGLDLLPDIHRLAPGVPVIVLTAYGKTDYAIRALRGDADEFLIKPVTVTHLTERALTLARQGREARKRAPRARTVLTVGAHPDDIEIGVGASLAAHQAAGNRLVNLVLSGGAVGGDMARRHEEAEAAAAIVGARLIHLDFPDTQLDQLAAPIITAIEEVIRDCQPDQVYTHTVHDRHQDHRATSHAVAIAARPVPSIACFQSPSSTVDFRPDQFIDVEDQLPTKLRMLAAHASQSHRAYMQADLVRATARYWARFGVGRYAEPLETIRSSVILAPPPGPAGELAPDDEPR